MIQVGITTKGDKQARQKLADVQQHLQHPRRPMAESGKYVSVTVRRHFLALDSRGNARGWPSRHFHLREGRDKTALTSVTDTEAVVSIASIPMLHRLLGGVVVPKRAKSLAIPLSAKAYAVGSPRNWEDGDGRLFRPKGRSILVQADPNHPGSLLLHYALRKRVTHRPHPEVIPPMEPIGRKILEIHQKHLQRELAR
jgi:hypothetical protein